MDLKQRPTITELRMRIAETRIRQHRVAAKLDISDGHLSHILAGRKLVDDEMVDRIARAIEDVVSDGDDRGPVEVPA